MFLNCIVVKIELSGISRLKWFDFQLNDNVYFDISFFDTAT